MDPGTVALISAVSAAASALGSIVQGNAASSASKYDAKVAANNAEISRQNAALAAREGAANAAIEQQKTRATVGAIKADQAGAGIDVNTGSAVDVRSSAAELGQLNAITIRSNAARKAYGYQTEASNYEGQSSLDKSKAKGATAASYIDAGTSILGGAAKASKSGAWDDFNSSSSLNEGS